MGLFTPCAVHATDLRERTAASRSPHQMRVLLAARAPPAPTPRLRPRGALFVPHPKVFSNLLFARLNYIESKRVRDAAAA